MTARRTREAGGAVPTYLPATDAAWLAPLLDPSGLATFLAGVPGSEASGVDGCIMKHVRYRPGSCCLVLFEASVAGDPVSLYAVSPAHGRDPIPAEPGSSAPGRLLGGPVRWPGDSSVLREFPLDARLSGLAALADPSALASSIVTGAFAPGAAGPFAGEFRTLRYKPENRLVLKAELEWTNRNGGGRSAASCLVRFEHHRSAGAEAALAGAFARAAAGRDLLAVPGAGTRLDDPGCTVLPWVPGADLARPVRYGDTGAAALAGRALAEVATLEVPGLPVRAAAAVLDELTSQVAVLEARPLGSDLEGRFAALLSALGPGPDLPGEETVHGDFHQGQLLSHEGRVLMLDWDRAHRGDPTEDYGNFLAQMHLLELRGRTAAGPPIDAFEAAFIAAGGKVPDPDRVRFWTARSLLELALREVRRLRRDWPHRAGVLLDRCGAVLEAGGAR